MLDQDGETVCDHRFCSGCLRRWVHLHNTCPVCRRAIDYVQIVDCRGHRRQAEHVATMRRKKLLGALRTLQTAAARSVLVEQCIDFMAPQMSAAFRNDNVVHLANFVTDYFDPTDPLMHQRLDLPPSPLTSPPPLLLSEDEDSGPDGHNFSAGL